MSKTQARLSKSLIEYGLKPFAIAAVFVLLALIWTFPLQRLVAYPFLFLFFGAILASAWFGGLVSGLMSIGMSSFLIVFFFIPPLYSISIAKESRTYVVSYMLCALAISVVGSVRKRAETAILSARDELELRVQERTSQLQHSNLELIQRERQLRLLTEAIPQQIWSADAAGSIEYCNQGLIDHIGRNAAELQGEAFYSIFHTDDALPFRQKWDAARDAADGFEAQVRIRGVNANYRWFLVRGIPQRAADGEILRWYGVHIDIEEHQSAQQRLFLAHEHLSRFTRTMSMAEMAASIAHELNQPLTALMTHAFACRRWLAAEPSNVTRATAAADSVVRESERAGAVIKRVRSLFSKSDYVRESTDLNRLIVDLARLLRDDATRRGVSIKLTLDRALPSLNVDPIQIQQVLLNLATNSMDAMMECTGPRTLEIVSTYGEPGAVIVSVKDSGPGFTDQIEARIFEPFFTTKPEGTGMGLAICRSILEAHDGRIWAARSSSGAVFSFSLKVPHEKS